jgi:hypothetical protein
LQLLVLGLGRLLALSGIAAIPAPSFVILVAGLSTSKMLETPFGQADKSL